MRQVLFVLLLGGLLLFAGCCGPTSTSSQEQPPTMPQYQPQPSQEQIPSMPQYIAEPNQAEVKIKETTFNLEAGQQWYYGGSYQTDEEVVQFRYIVESNRPVEIYVVASESDFRLISTGEEFVQYPACRGIQIYTYNQVCNINSRGGIVILNEGDESVTVHVRVYVVP